MQSTRPSDRGGASVLVASKTKWLFGWAQKLKIAVSEQTPLRQYRGEKKQHRPHWANEAVLSPPRPQPPPLVAQSTYALPRGVPEEQRQRRAQFCRKGEGGTSWSSPPWCLCEASFLSGACTKMQPLPQRPLPSASCDQVGAVALGCLPPRAGVVRGYARVHGISTAHPLPGAVPHSSHYLKNLRTKERQKK